MRSIAQAFLKFSAGILLVALSWWLVTAPQNHPTSVQAGAGKWTVVASQYSDYPVWCLVNTHSGETWQALVLPVPGSAVWQPIPRLTSDDPVHEKLLQYHDNRIKEDLRELLSDTVSK